MDGWKRDFVEKLGKAQAQCTRRFEEAVAAHVTSAYADISSFVRDHGFKVTTPLQENGRRSFKFELAENAYVLLLFRFTSVGEFELRTDMFVPGSEPILKKSIGRIADIDGQWAQAQFRAALDKFVELLNGCAAADSRVGSSVHESSEELAVV